MKKALVLALLGLFALTAGAVSAADLLTLDGGFETPILADGATAAGPGTVGGWPFYTTGTMIINPVGDGSASEGLVVEDGSNYLKMMDDPVSEWADPRTQFYSAPTIKAGYKYTLRFRLGKSSDPNKTWTRNTLLFGACPNGVNFAGAQLWYNGYILGSQVQNGWNTMEFTHTVDAGDPYIGSSVGFYLNGETWSATDTYYYDKFELLETLVPEPGTLVALGTGLVGLVGSTLRRRRACWK